MVKDKLKKTTLRVGDNQKYIASFFSAPGTKVLASVPQNKECNSKEKASSNIKQVVLSPIGCSANQRENLTSSPDPLYVPETPDSQIREARPLNGASLSLRRSLTARRSLLSPGPGRKPFGQAPLGAQNSPVHSVSVKRPMCGFEGAPKTKHMRTMSAMPCGGPVDVYSLLHDDDLTACLKAINDTSAPLVQHRSSCAGKDADQKFLKAGQTLSQSSSGVRLKMKGKAPLRPIQLNGALSDVLGNRPCSLSGSTFPGITEQKSDAILKRQSDRTLLNCPVTQHDVVKPDGKWEVADMPSPLSSDAGSGPAQQSRDKHGPVGGSESAPSQDELAGDEDFWLDDMMMVNELKEVESDTDKCKAIPDHVILSTGLYNRYWVLDVQEAVGPKGYPEKRLEVTASKSAKPTEMCILRDGWESTMVSAGDIVHLEGQCTSGTWVIDRDSGLLVLMPDVLISSTSIASSIRCMRRAVLGERFKAFDGGSKQMLNGTIVHEVFQKAVEAGDFSPEKLQQLSQDLLLGPSHISEMYRLKLMQEDMKQEVEEYLPHMSDWARDYLHSSPLSGKKQLMLKLPSEGPVYKQEGACSVTVSDFLDIEENIWSPRFGLKGKIDLTAKVRIHRRGRPSLERVMPLELKTGRESNSIEHRSQVILYNLMSLERRSDPEVGFLLYLKTGSMHPIVSSQMDKRELLKLRNVLVHYLGNSLLRGEGKTPSLAPLPAVISDPQACKYCPQMRNCAFYSRAVERRGPGDGPDEPFLELESSHLKEAHLQYFSHWVLLCALEAGATEIKGGQRNIWLQSAQEREIQGGCMGNLRITGEVTSLAGNTYTHHFERQGGERAGTCLSVGDWVVVSGQDSGLIAVARGHVRKVTGTGAGVTCSLDRNLSKFSSEVVFRLDQYDGEGGLYTHLGNLSKLMENATSSERLRKLIVDFQPPRFIESLSSVLPRDAKEKVANILKGLNKPQKQAMKKVLLSKDYTLIVGMPGTGKTTTICSLVRILHACGFSVLVTSYTHSAVDNILLKLKKFRIGFLRLGQAQKVHPDIQPFTEEHLCANGVRTLPELERLYNSELVVGSTCMGVKHCLFSRRRFDFCVVDEASQISQPLCLGPLFYADRFVLVGDHQQLSPIVKSSEARTLGMEESLFKRLECHNNAVVQLNMQYRMNSKIMSLSNMLMYEGKLECGSERTANATLQLPERDAVAQELCLSRPEYLAWIHAALEPQNPVCFLDTVKLPAPETVMKGGISNPTEAILVHSMVSLLLKAGCRAGDIGVIAPYRMQLNAISSLLSDPAFSAVEVNTVDKYQGRDKSVIIVSFVRSHTEGNLGTLLKDCRRLNVAVTRAKHKLLMLGSSPSLRRYAPLNRLLNHLEQERMSFHQLLTRHYQP